MFIKKRQLIYCVLKLFKTIKQSDLIAIKPCFNVIQDMFSSRGYNIVDIEVNYGEKKMKKANSFYRFIETHDIVSFSVNLTSNGGFSNLHSIGFDYSNHLLNLKHRTEEKGYADFCLVFPQEWYSLDMAKSLVKALDKEIALTYAYMCFLPEDFDFNSERPVKKTLFTISSRVTQNDIELRNNLKNIDCGFIPKKYPVNFYNDKQMEKLFENAKVEERISNGLTLITYKS